MLLEAQVLDNPLQVVNQDALAERLTAKRPGFGTGTDAAAIADWSEEFQSIKAGVQLTEPSANGLVAYDGLLVEPVESDWGKSGMKRLAKVLPATQAGATEFRDWLKDNAEAEPLVISSKLGLVSQELVKFDPQEAEPFLAEWSATVVDPSELLTFQANVAALSADPEHLEESLRMWNGVPVPDTNDPYRDAIMLVGQGDSVCTAILVSPDVAITASHCVCLNKPFRAVVGTSLLSPMMQVIDIDQARSASYLPCSIFEQLASLDARIGDGDLGVVHLRAPASDVEFHKVASVATLGFVQTVRAAGYGESNENGILAMRGKYVAEIIIASKDCTDIAMRFPDRGYRCSATHEMIAAGGNTDTCKGDSGGPIYVIGFNPVMELVGITSRSVDPHGGCGAGGIYVKLGETRFRDWLIGQGVPPEIFASN